MNEERRKNLKFYSAKKKIEQENTAKGLVTEFLIGEKGEPGKDGKTPSKGELTELIVPMIPDPIPGKDGKDGADGKTPTKKELEQVIAPLIPTPEKGLDGKDGTIYTYAGNWTYGRSYKLNDVVTHDGSSFVCLKAHDAKNINEPDIGTEWPQFWGVVARKGDKGEKGEPGQSGGGGGSSGGVQSVIAGANITVDSTDPQNPIVSASGGGGGGGTVDSVVAGNNIDVDATDPANPIVSVENLVVADITDVTASAAELNIMDGVTADATEINKLDGLTPTTAELNHVDGVTSAIQTQLDGKVDESLYDANSILIATADNTPIALTVAASRILGRGASGDINDLTAAEVSAITDQRRNVNLPLGVMRPEASSGTWSRVQNSTSFMGSWETNTSAANGDYIELNVSLPTGGTWTVELFHSSLSNAGILDVLQNGVSIGTVDMYAAGTAQTRSEVSTTFSPTGGSTTLKLLLNGKNASSSSYLARLHAIQFTRTA